MSSGSRVGGAGMISLDGEFYYALARCKKWVVWGMNMFRCRLMLLGLVQVSMALVVSVAGVEFA